MDISKIIATVIEKIKVFVWPLFVLSTVLLFFPKGWISYLGLTNLINDNKVWISLVFLISLSFVMVEIFNLIKRFIMDKIKKRKLLESLKGNFGYLSATQRYIVHFMYASNTSSGMYLNIAHPEVSDLVAKRIIYRTSTVGQLTSFAHSLTPLAIKVIEGDSKILREIVETYNFDDVNTSAVGRVIEL